MTAIDGARRHLRELRRDERGMAVATALIAMTVAFAFASAAVVYSVNTQHGTTRDHEAKEAIAAADAGVNVALMRLNQFYPSLTSATPCVGVVGAALAVTAAEAGGWCPQLTGTVGASSYSYRVGPSTAACTTATACIVAVGTSNGVSNRVEVSLASMNVGGPFQHAGVVGQEDITLENHAEIRVGVGTNGNVILGNNSSICGDIRHGVGKETVLVPPATQCPGYTQTEGNEALPQVSEFIPEDIATNNEDPRLVKCTSETPIHAPAECQSDSYSKKWETNTPWNPTTRTIEPAQNSSLTLNGNGDYFVCRLILGNNTQLIMGANATVRIFFDTPENCHLSAGAEQISVASNSSIVSSGYQPGAGKYSLVGLYLLGSETVPTSVVFRNRNVTESELEGPEKQFVLYAPNSNVYLENHSTFKGAIAGKTVHLANNATVVQDAGYKPTPFGGWNVFARQSYVECVGATASPPNAEC